MLILNTCTAEDTRWKSKFILRICWLIVLWFTWEVISYPKHNVLSMEFYKGCEIWIVRLCVSMPQPLTIVRWRIWVDIYYLVFWCIYQIVFLNFCLLFVESHRLPNFGDYICKKPCWGYFCLSPFSYKIDKLCISSVYASVIA